MINSKAFLIFAFSMFLVFSIPANPSANDAYACSCVSPDSPKKELQRHDAVFSGTAISMKELHPTEPLYFSADPVVVTFEIDKMWKGLNSSDSITVHTPQSSASCGYGFETDREYIVYASYDNDDKGQLEVSLCSRTSLLSDASKDIEELGTGLSIDPVFSTIMSPLKQFKSGVAVDGVQCGESLIPVAKHDGSPACLKPESVPKLIERGWVIKSASFDIQEERVVLIEISKNEVLSKGTGFDLPKDEFTLEDLKELEQKEKELRKLRENPETLHEEHTRLGEEITVMQDRLQNPFQTGVPYHLVKILKEKHEVFLSHFSDLIGAVRWTGSSPNDISHVHHALRIGMDPDHFTLSELEYQDKKIREYLGNEMSILYKKSGYNITLDR